MTPSELKKNYIKNNPKGHFFDKENMKFFGDTMKNYRVISAEDGNCDMWELVRKLQTPQGFYRSAYFKKDNFEIYYG